MEQERLTKKEIDLKDSEQYYFSLPPDDDTSHATDTLPAEDEKSRMTDVLDPYLHKIFEVSDKYLKRVFNEEILNGFRIDCFRHIRGDRNSTIEQYVKAYYDLVKREYRKQYTNADPSLNQSIFSEPHIPKALWGDCLDFLRRMDSESVQLMVTSPPYYNARDYSQWATLDDYLDDMSCIIKECYRVLDNHRPFVFNVGDIFDNDNRHTESSWGKRRIPLGAYFTKIFEDHDFQFVDDFIWDKGEVQTQRHKNGNRPYPLYQYPINCYEHIFVFYKHRLDKTLYPCPVCGCLKVNGNAYSGIGIKSWECKNLDCFERSAANRGKRFSARTQLMTGLQQEVNFVEEDLLRQWRRDVVKFAPVIKINSNGQNILGHTAPFPKEIPEYAVRVFTGVNESVLDPFAGAFTTTIESFRQGRNSIGIELNRTMFRDAVLTRFSNTLGTRPKEVKREWI
ncbi:MAG: site-specific DNA-methyltransferase [Candidatus Poribacteria bacterium]|nr:site-specific DNA-methyltransferase [Candidatus Poribacteria bacterium]